MSVEPYDAQDHMAESLERIADALETLAKAQVASLKIELGREAGDCTPSQLAEAFKQLWDSS